MRRFVCTGLALLIFGSLATTLWAYCMAMRMQSYGYSSAPVSPPAPRPIYPAVPRPNYQSPAQVQAAYWQAMNAQRAAVAAQKASSLQARVDSFATRQQAARVATAAKRQANLQKQFERAQRLDPEGRQAKVESWVATAQRCEAARRFDVARDYYAVAFRLSPESKAGAEAGAALARTRASGNEAALERSAGRKSKAPSADSILTSHDRRNGIPSHAGDSVLVEE